MKNFWQQTFGVALLCIAAVNAFAGGEEVVVVYNSRSAESKSVAEHYAQVRAVPTNQIFGFDLTTNENVTRLEFHESLQKPLAKMLEEKNLWHVGSEIFTSTNGEDGRVIWKVQTSKIRYAVLCYGIPLHITEDAALVEPGTDKMRPEMRRNEAAVDSELACLPVFEQHLPAAGALRNPHYTTTNAASINPTNEVLIVTRLDGPTAEIARSLVDKAVQAERDGLWGRAYFDERSVGDVGYKIGDEWIAAAANISRLFGFETVEDTNAATFSATFPMSQIALYAGWYDENVSGPFTRTNVEFMPGAFAYHLHSFSATTLRSATQRWCGPFLARGATCTMGCVAEPYLAGTPDIGTFFGRFIFYGFTFGEAACASQSVLSWQTTVVGDPLYRPFGKIPKAQHEDLERRQSKLLEWSYLKLVNYALVQKNPPLAVLNYLESIPLLKQSAVLTEKLGDLNAAVGKPNSAIRAYQAALLLDPSPLQRERLNLVLAQKLQAQNPDAPGTNFPAK